MAIFTGPQRFCKLKVVGLLSIGPMILRLGYDIQFEIPSPVAMVALLNAHLSRVADLRDSDELRVEPAAQTETYI